MDKVLLDTDVLSEILKRRNPTLLARAQAYAAVRPQFTFTAVSVHEIIYGLEGKAAYAQLKRAEAVFELNEVLLPTLPDFELAGRTRGIARRQGRQLTMDDCLIAAVAVRCGLPVATGNWGHFQAAQAAGLPVILQNWHT